jgi:lipopolysaccharide export system protein LptA
MMHDRSGRALRSFTILRTWPRRAALRGALRAAMIAGASSLFAIPRVDAQAGRPCTIIVDNLPRTSRTSYNRSLDLWGFGGGFHGRCQGTTMVVTSDSAEFQEGQGVVRLIGRARYVEGETVLQADRMTYYERDARLDAEGNVRAQTPTTSMTAGAFLYYRAIPGVRPTASGFARGRPHIAMRDTTIADSVPTTIDADRLYTEHDSLFFAAGKVVITRPDLVATSDSAELDKVRQFARLLAGAPRIVGTGTHTFTIDGRIIDLFGAARRLERLLARGDAVAVSDSLHLTADTLDLLTTGGRIDTVTAWGPTRAHAVSAERDIVADSLRLHMPDQRLERLFAVGRARVESAADSTLRTSERDWISGDTVIAHFARTVPDDTTRRVSLESMFAVGDARSFYQLPNKEHSDSLPTLNYVSGARIDISFAGGEVERVHVSGAVQGVTLEPLRPRGGQLPPPPRPPRSP